MKTVIMPKFGFTQEDAQLVRWLKQAGQTVEQGEPIAEVTTDKVNMEVEAPASGTLAGLRAKEGETVPVTAVIAYILAPGETPPPEAEAAPQPAAASPAPESARVQVSPVAARLAAEQGVDARQVAGSGPGGRVTRRDVEAYLAGDGKVRATPAARRAARELGVPLGATPGSGPRGRVQAGDVRAAEPAAPSAGVKIIPLAGMRRTIAARMQRSAQEAPHITFDIDVEVSAAEALREQVNRRLTEGQPRVSLTALIARATAWALRRHPLLNSRLEGDNILVLPGIHLGLAVALEEGLIVPVVRDADRKGVLQLAAEIADLSERARSNRLLPDDVAEGTFTISNLGMFGVDRFTAILNPPQAGILAIGRVARRVVPDEADRPVVRPTLTLTLSADHRVVDGAVAARFLADLRAGLEQPGLLVM
jgi:pyruvate dehydrogenase E2 component (dihydrolipoamide acetyltransferase)